MHRHVSKSAKGLPGFASKRPGVKFNRKVTKRSVERIYKIFYKHENV